MCHPHADNGSEVGEAVSKMKQWKAIYVNARHEKKIQQKLTEIGIEAYVPIQRQLRQWSDRKKWVEMVLVGGFVFVRVDAYDRDKVFYVDGVLNYLRMEGKDAIIRDSEIEQMKNFIQSGYYVSVEKVDREYFKRGDFIKVQDGVFKGWEGVVYRKIDPEHLEIHINSLNMVFRVQIPKVAVTKR
jgi:transcription antitermination factor NusG